MVSLEGKDDKIKFISDILCRNVLCTIICIFLGRMSLYRLQLRSGASFRVCSWGI